MGDLNDDRYIIVEQLYSDGRLWGYTVESKNYGRHEKNRGEVSLMAMKGKILNAGCCGKALYGKGCELANLPIRDVSERVEAEESARRQADFARHISAMLAAELGDDNFELF